MKNIRLVIGSVLSVLGGAFLFIMSTTPPNQRNDQFNTWQLIFILALVVGVLFLVFHFIGKQKK
jgi:uncharacterized membrane protein YdbT with pleckstrin-like domain